MHVVYVGIYWGERGSCICNEGRNFRGGSYMSVLLFSTGYVDHVYFSRKSCVEFAPRTGSCTLSECLTLRRIHISIVVTEEARGCGVVVCWWLEFNIHPIRGVNPPSPRVSLLYLSYRLPFVSLSIAGICSFGKSNGKTWNDGRRASLAVLKIWSKMTFLFSSKNISPVLLLYSNCLLSLIHWNCDSDLNSLDLFDLKNKDLSNSICAISVNNTFYYLFLIWLSKYIADCQMGAAKESIRSAHQ